MAKYTYICLNKECLLENIFEISVNNFLKNNFKSNCKSCNSETERVLHGFQSRFSRTHEEELVSIKEEARIIADKIKSGDQSLIRNIYGEELNNKSEK